MKTILIILTSLIFFGGQFIFSQIRSEKDILLKENSPIYLETGINLSLPVHIEMYRSHRLAVGINARAAKKISNGTEVGIRAEYDYRFIKKNSRILTTESTLEEKASHSNFSLISIKPNIQFNLNYHWCFGVESGIGYAISDADSEIGLGWVSEYNNQQQFGSCSGIYIGKHFLISSNKKELGLSLNLTNFLAEGHAENTLGLKINYRLIN